MYPVIWYKLNNNVVEGIETITTVISYQSPCNLFSELMIDQKASHELREWCENEFQNAIGDSYVNVGPKDSDLSYWSYSGSYWFK
jgi:hypothetical protein